MKIYPGKHRIYNVTEIDANRDIALGYLDSEFLEEKIIINVNDELSVDSSTELLPYTSLKSAEITLYNKDGKPLNKEEQEKLLIKQITGNYIYTPKASVTFEPLTFGYKVLAKKNMKYLTSRKYNIKAACSDKELASKMIQFFSDSYERNLCPTNIKFNNGDKKLESLFNSSIEDIDFIFINSDDGKTFDGDTEIPINEYINNNTIPWIICDNLPDEDEIDYEEQEALKFEISNLSVTNASPFETSYYFKVPNDVRHLLKNEEIASVTYHNIFKHYNDVTPILIKEIVNKGFVIYANSEFMARISELSDVFYEVLMYVYFRSYIATQTITEWITDVMPNYIVQNGRLTQKEKFTSHMELHKLLGLREGDVIPINVEIEEPKIAYYTGMSSNYLVFKKIPKAETADPIKAEEQISIFTERKNIMFYDNFVYVIKEDISDKISCSVDNGILKTTVKSFKHTDLDTGSYQTETASYELNNELMSQEIKLTWNKNLKTIELVSELRDELILMASIQVIKEKKDSKLYDMRQRGGGLPENQEDNYDCLDIGHVLGRPYRKGGSLITTVSIPKKYEYKKDVVYEIIYNTIRKHMIADDYLVLNLEFK
jgi:hypothetical protein|nr:MAG TPA: hypothetical protein [Caudoviricetes sp.]